MPYGTIIGRQAETINEECDIRPKTAGVRSSLLTQTYKMVKNKDLTPGFSNGTFNQGFGCSMVKEDCF